MRDVSATETAIIYGLEPLWGAGFAWFLLGERWGALGWIGAALVLGKLFIHLHVLFFILFFGKNLNPKSGNFTDKRTSRIVRNLHNLPGYILF